MNNFWFETTEMRLLRIEKVLEYVAANLANHGDTGMVEIINAMTPMVHAAMKRDHTREITDMTNKILNFVDDVLRYTGGVVRQEHITAFKAECWRGIQTMRIGDPKNRDEHAVITQSNRLRNALYSRLMGAGGMAEALADELDREEG